MGTEGIVADLHKGSDAKLLGTYVSTPLCWGVHVGAGSTLESMEDLHENKGRYAVSRMGSGSHLMALVDVRTRLGDAAAAALQFEIVGGLSGAKDALKQSAELAFMWEKFTTKPLVDSGDLKRIGEVYTPWPCFLLAATPEALATPQPLIAMLNAVQAEANELRARSNAAQVGEKRIFPGSTAYSPICHTPFSRIFSICHTPFSLYITDTFVFIFSSGDRRHVRAQVWGCAGVAHERALVLHTVALPLHARAGSGGARRGRCARAQRAAPSKGAARTHHRGIGLEVI